MNTYNYWGKGKMKKCPKCGKVLPDNMFAPHTKYCRICRRDYDWQYRYGISAEQYLELYENQNGKCKICGKSLPDDKYLCVDHDKNTGEIRGLLCSDCNRGLGCFNDDTEIMEKAISYLKKDNKNE